MPWLPLLIAAGLLLTLTACADQRQDAPPLPDREWTIVAIDGAPTQGDPAPNLRFTAGAISGHGGVNRFSGTATVENGRVAIGPLRMTRMAGPPAQMDQENAIVRALSAARTWSIVGSDLLLQDADGAARIRAR